MRFIVDLYRYLIFVICAVILISVTLAVLYGSSHGAAWGLFNVLLGMAALVLTLLALGITATFISLHDRHTDLVDEVARLADALEERGSPPA